MNINDIMRQLAEYQRIAEDTADIIEGLKDQIKAYMTTKGLETLKGDEHKATYKTVTSSRIDTKALRADLPDIAQQYTRSTTTQRFTFA